MGDIRIINHNGSHVNIVVGSGRSMDDNRTTNTITILSKGVAVIPRSTIGRCEPCVGPGTPVSSNGTFSNAGNTIHIVGALLTDTVEMDGSGVVLQFVDDGDRDVITPVGLEDWSGDLAVDGKRNLWCCAIE